ncbi:MAG: DUF4442 domain-containing protein [Bdellovibrionales bacterium]
MIDTVKSLGNQAFSKFPDRYKDTALLQLFSFAKIPLLFALRPRVVEMTPERCQIKIPLTRMSKNHLGCMYFAALAAGADTAGGLAAMREIQESGEKVSLIFKDFHAEFLKRAEADVVFTCDEVAKVRELVQKTIETKERENLTFNVTAACPSISNEDVAKFQLTLSLKCRS